MFLLYPLLTFGQNQDFFSDSVKARELNRKANILGLNGFHTQALDTFFYCLQLRKKLYGNEDYNLGAVYSGIGITYRSLGQLDLSLKYFNLAEKNYLLKKDIKTRPIANLYRNIGNLYRGKLDFNKALQYFEKALSIYQSIYQSSKELPHRIASMNYNIAEIYYLTNDYENALNIINTNLPNAYIEDQILYLELLAFIYHIKEKTAEAKRCYQDAIQLTIEFEEENDINIATVYLNYALYLISINDLQEAMIILDKAFPIIKITQPNYGEILAAYYLYNGDLVLNLPVETKNLDFFKQIKIKNLKEAVTYYKKGLIALKFPENYSTDSISEMTGMLSLIKSIRFLKKIADTYSDIATIESNEQPLVLSESLKQAIENYQIVSSLIQRARKEISSDESKIQLTALEYATFYNVIQTSFQAYSITNDYKYIVLAFQNAERVKGSSIFENISDQLALENSLVPDSLLELEKRINNTIAIYSGKIMEENENKFPDSILLRDFNNILFAATRDRENLNAYIESEYKDYYDLKYSNSMFSLKEIQQKLKNDQIILEYVLNETDTINELYTFVISTNNIDFSKQLLKKDFSASLENVFHFMSNTEYLFTKNEDSKKFCYSAYKLYSKLILPFKNEIYNKNLIVIPDGKLSYIPFEGLLETLPDTADLIEFDKLNYLIKNYNINYSNSANLLFKQSNSSKKTKIKTLAFAPEYSAEKIEIGGKIISLVPLPGVLQEVNQISETVNTKLFIGKEATETNFRKNVEDYGILHLAMHAFINDSLPALSSLAFTQSKSEDSKADGLLNTLDIYNLKLNAKLTVLSACNTGSGQLKKGEGILSLSRGFLYAGCPSIIMSLWEVDDQSGTQIMSSFYSNLKKGKPKDEALRAAKLEYLTSANSRKAHPHYWLGFVSIGDNSPLYISYDFYFFIILIFALSGIGIDQFIRIKKARKKRAS